MALATPIPFPFGSTTHTCAAVVLPATQRVAQDMGLAVVDFYGTFQGREEAFTDADHLQVRSSLVVSRFCLSLGPSPPLSFTSDRFDRAVFPITLSLSLSLSLSLLNTG